MILKTFSLVFCGISLAAMSTPAEAQASKRQQSTASRSSGRNFRASNVELYRSLMDRYGRQFGVDPDFVAAVMTIESSGNPNCRSSAGAMGLMQLMPGTCRDLGVQNPYDPEENVRGGAQLLGQHLRRYRGNLTLVLAAYNAGPRRAEDGSWTNIEETRRYVANVLNVYGGTDAAVTAPQAPKPALQTPMPSPVVVDRTNYIDLMFSAIYATKTAEEQNDLVENSALSTAAENLLSDVNAGKIGAGSVNEAASAAAALAGFSGSVDAVVLITPDSADFKEALSKSSTAGRRLGLAHGMKGKNHVWVIVNG